MRKIFLIFLCFSESQNFNSSHNFSDLKVSFEFYENGKLLLLFQSSYWIIYYCYFRPGHWSFILYCIFLFNSQKQWKTLSRQTLFYRSFISIDYWSYIFCGYSVYASLWIKEEPRTGNFILVGHSSHLLFGEYIVQLIEHTILRIPNFNFPNLSGHVPEIQAEVEVVKIKNLIFPAGLEVHLEDMFWV